MPLTRPLAAPRSCLRCQLRQVILGTRTPTCVLGSSPKEASICRQFTTSPCSRQEEEEGEGEVFLKKFRSDDRRKALYRREYPLGRVIGRPGRRQRESSQTLKIDSMRRPFDVVLMRDIQEPRAQGVEIGVEAVTRTDQNSGISAAEIADELLNEKKNPDQEEVNVSIDSLRPSTSVIDDDHMNKLRTSLSDAYTGQQLSLYLKYLNPQLPVGSSKQDHVLGGNDVQRSVWRPGRTPLRQRHSLSVTAKKGRKFAGKKKAIDNIIRHGWNLTLDSDEQRTGELEINVEDWQMRYLFDLRAQDKPYYEHVIQPPILRHACEILDHRADNIIRIVGRRSDAEEIPRLIERELEQVQKLEVDLKCFKPMKGQPGWPSKLSEVLSESEMNYVGRHTSTVIVRRSETVIDVYSKSDSARQQGKRLLLSLLNLPSPSKVELFNLFGEGHGRKGRHPSQATIQLPEIKGDEMTLQNRNWEMSRLVLPARMSKDKPESMTRPRTDIQSPSASSVAKKLASFQNDDRSLPAERDFTGSPAKSYWKVPSDIVFSPWQAQLCKILHSFDEDAPSRALSKAKSVKQRVPWSTVQPQAPNLNKLLQYFSPKANNAFAFDVPTKPSRLAAHFFPSPFGAAGLHALRNLPRIVLVYSFVEQDDSILELVEGELLVKHQELRVPLPHESVDVRFTRSLQIPADLEFLRGDEQIQRFTQTLNQSAANSTAALSGEPSINVKLPRWMANILKLEDSPDQLHNEVELEYFFERFEQVQTAEFTAMDSKEVPEGTDQAITQTLDTLRDSIFLEYAEAEGGIVAGSRTELSLKYRDTSHPQSGTNEDMTPRGDTRIVEAALNMASAITCIDSSPNTSR